MRPESRLAFDPIARAAELWEESIGPADSMRVATSIMRVQQMVGGTLDAALKPYNITFARYEVLRLLSFSRTGGLPLSKIGERLMVHPTSVTNAIDRLVAQGLVDREVDARDRRRVLASLTPAGVEVLDAATRAIVEIEFGLGALSVDELSQLFDLLRRLRAPDFSP